MKNFSYFICLVYSVIIQLFIHFINQYLLSYLSEPYPQIWNLYGKNTEMVIINKNGKNIESNNGENTEPITEQIFYRETF